MGRLMGVFLVVLGICFMLRSRMVSERAVGIARRTLRIKWHSDIDLKVGRFCFVLVGGVMTATGVYGLINPNYFR